MEPRELRGFPAGGLHMSAPGASNEDGEIESSNALATNAGARAKRVEPESGAAESAADSPPLAGRRYSSVRPDGMRDHTSMLVGNRPEMSPLDAHLFADLKRAIRRHIVTNLRYSSPAVVGTC